MTRLQIRARARAAVAQPGALVIAMIAALQAVIAALLIYVLLDLRGYQECMARWQQQSTIATSARATASEGVDRVMDEVFLSISSGSQGDFDAAVQRYIEERQLQVETRQLNPLPPLPTAVCGDAT